MSLKTRAVPLRLMLDIALLAAVFLAVPPLYAYARAIDPDAVPLLLWSSAIMLAIFSAMTIAEVISLRREMRQGKASAHLPPSRDAILDASSHDELVWRAADASRNRLDPVLGALITRDGCGCAIALTPPMINSLTGEELTAVMINLLYRFGEGATGRAIGGPFGMPPVLTQLFDAAVQAYEAGDRRAALAMRDPAPIATALVKTRASDPWIPGSTIDDALSTWTWPGPTPALSAIPGDVPELLIMAADAMTGRPRFEPTERAEALRLAALARVSPFDG